jgi:hypothetical protein
MVSDQPPRQHLLSSSLLDTRQELNRRLDSATSTIKSFHSNGFGGVRQTSLYVSNSETPQPLDSQKESSLSSFSHVSSYSLRRDLIFS